MEGVFWQRSGCRARCNPNLCLFLACPRRKVGPIRRILAALNNNPERIGSLAAREILEALAKGTPLAQQTLEARTALQPLAWRSGLEIRQSKP
jgi:hypothetical protein